jgi:DNA-binding protein HU-beta
MIHGYKNQYKDRTFAPRLKKVLQRVSIKNDRIMTKAEIVNQISETTGVEKVAVQAVVEAMMKNVKDSLSKGENVYLRGFGSFIIKKRAEKKGRNISKNTTIVIPAHNIPSFKPAKVFMEQVKKKVK